MGEGYTVKSGSLLVTRRAALKTGLASAALAAIPLRGAFAASTITMADIGVGDPGSWERFTKETGKEVNLVSIGNAPSAVVNELLAAGGLQQLQLVNIVGGMQKPLVENDLILPLDTSRLPNWSRDNFIQNYLSEGTPGFDFIGLEGQVYGVPTVLQGDSFAYLPDETGELASYGALFDPKFRGFVALEDNYTTAGQKTALYLKQSGQAQIADPADMTPEELKTVVDFLIEQKKAGQFRVIWSSFEQAVNLLTSKEVHVMDCWEPMVFVARDKGLNAVYADPKEGYLLWAMAAYIVNNPNMSEDELEATYQLLNFMLDGWYGAKITLSRGYMTNPQAVPFAKESDEFTEEEAAKIEAITEGVKAKFEKGGTWQNRWPTHVDAYEEQWQRFKAA
jgi:spermidine/putrescine-binding protein